MQQVVILCTNGVYARWTVGTFRSSLEADKFIKEAEELIGEKLVNGPKMEVLDNQSPREFITALKARI